MEYTAEMNFFSNIVEKLSPDFVNQHPKAVLGCALVIILAPTISSKLESNFRYWVDAKYGKPANMVLEASDPMLLSESTAA